MKATWYKADGSVEQVTPKNGTDFNIDELHGYVGGYIDTQPLPKTNEIMVLNDNGKLDGLPKNELATEIWKKAYPIAEFPNNNDELVVGDVLVCDTGMIK